MEASKTVTWSIENRLMDMGMGKEGEGKMNGKSIMEGYTLPYVR